MCLAHLDAASAVAKGVAKGLLLAWTSRETEVDLQLALASDCAQPLALALAYSAQHSLGAWHAQKHAKPPWNLWVYYQSQRWRVLTPRSYCAGFAGSRYPWYWQILDSRSLAPYAAS
jgi:hypothetical protein